MNGNILTKSDHDTYNKLLDINIDTEEDILLTAPYRDPLTSVPQGLKNTNNNSNNTPTGAQIYLASIHIPHLRRWWRNIHAHTDYQRKSWK